MKNTALAAVAAVLFASVAGRAADAESLGKLAPGAVGMATGERRVEAADARLQDLGREHFSVAVQLSGKAESWRGDLLSRRAADGKRGFRLFIVEEKSGHALAFEAAFDWKHPRNDRPLQVRVPVAALGAGEGHAVAVRFTGPKLELFVDGVLVDEEWPVGAVAHADGEPLLSDGAGSVGLWPRALSDDEMTRISGGAEIVARRERELLGPETPLRQYWRPRGFNTGVGDCMPFFQEGRFHLFYLLDRQRHGAKWGLGAHQWAHASSPDLIRWEHHPMAIPIDRQTEGSICTGSVIAHEGALHGFFAVRTADGSPARLTAASSTDGVHFEKADWAITLTPPYAGPPARDPMVFRDPASGLFHMLVTTELLRPLIAGHGGALAHLVSRDLRAWEQREPFIVPGDSDQPECPDFFAWNGWHYLVFSNHGVARYRMSRAPGGPWLKPKSDAFDGPQARVLKTAEFTGNRRLGAVFVTFQPDSYAGHLLFREIVQHPDGTLGTAFAPELRPALAAAVPLEVKPLADGISGDPQRVEIEAVPGLRVASLGRMPGDFHLKLRVVPRAGTGAFGITVRGSGAYEKGHELRFQPAREKVGWRATDAGTTDEHEHAAIYAVDGLDRPCSIELFVKGDLLDVCIDGRRTLVTRAPSWLTGDQLFLFAQDGAATFEQIEVKALAETP